MAFPSIRTAAEAHRQAVLADTLSALRHNPGISVNWTPDEQLTLEDLLAKYASDSTIVRYAKIAMELKDKTVRDVALRCRWMTKENGKQRKEDHSSARKIKDKKFIELHLGVTGKLLDQNAQMFSQISANFSASQIHDNIGLLCKARGNILTIMNVLNDLAEVLKQMPPLPVKVNEKLANNILPHHPIG
ncbi:hypothetical protein F3Y22_tig00112989pilonHSYRG00053 [Hibiscus syriacus]|uniref:Myb-like domain-containing protein n=1 Tax=Hibiscus syriacus TaxID=106335 RepID=A0A6A2Y169_HIBSY|nr:hypothetical protein F3Y22_tig00112989pilonHSYRG00053 [Hibiscus syriacus]